MHQRSQEVLHRTGIFTKGGKCITIHLRPLTLLQLGHCAQAESEGSVKKGRDGKRYVVRVDIRGIKSWKPLKAKGTAFKKQAVRAPQKPKAKVAAKRKATVKRTVNSSKAHKISFGEPRTHTPGVYFLTQSLPFTVTDEMYRIILKGGRRYDNRDGNAYVFGKLFNPSNYTFFKEHGNDVAQTGFIDVSLTVPKQAWSDDRAWKAFERAEYDWDDRAALQSLRRVNPAVLWVGETKGEDMISITVDLTYFFSFQEGTWVQISLCTGILEER